MPRFLIERNFAEELNITKEGAEHIKNINEEETFSNCFVRRLIALDAGIDWNNNDLSKPGRFSRSR